MTNLENLKQIKASFQKFNEEYKEIKGQMDKMDTEMKKEKMNPEMMDEMMKKMGDMRNGMMDRMYEMMNSVHQRINGVEDIMIDHKDPSKHLPEIHGAEQMQHCLDTLGLAGNFEVRKKVIYANTKRGLVVEAAYTKE